MKEGAFERRGRDQYCIACGFSATLDVSVKRCPRCKTLFPKRSKEYDRLVAEKMRGGRL